MKPVLYLLGRAAMRAGSDERPLGVPLRAVEIVSLLALHHGQKLLRSFVSETIWPDVPEEQGRANLRRHLHLLSRHLPDQDEQPWVLADKTNLWWNEQAFCQVDVREFQRHAESEDAHDAIAWYGGDLLPESYADWIEPYRSRLRAHASALLHKEAESDDAAHAIAAAQRALEIDPFDEAMLRRLMDLRAQSGDRAGALMTYRRFEQRLREELAAAPQPETTAAFELLLHAVGATNQNQNLPRPTSTFVGRKDDAADVLRLLESERLVTLVGPGGIGKTRLALESAWKLLGVYDGVWFVDFANLTTGADVAEVIRRTIGDTASNVSALEALRKRIDGERVLFVFDNCEHIRADAGIVARKLVDAGAHILATSRRTLGVIGEARFALAPLEIPASGAALKEIGSSPAVRLFVDRASQVQPLIALDGRTAPQIARIVSHLNGLPLAIELAASRVNVLSLDAIADAVSRSIDVLRSNAAQAQLPRHGTLESTITWSVDMLSAERRKFFAELSVFPGTWDIAAAQAVCSGVGRDQTVTAVTDLVDTSLVTVWPDAEGIRYRLLDPIRHYAEHLPETAPDALRARHAEHFGQRLMAASHLRQTKGIREYRSRVRTDHHNIAAALEWYEQQGDLERLAPMVHAMAWYWRRGGFVREGWQTVQRLLAAYESYDHARSRAEIRRTAGILANGLADWTASARLNLLAERDFAAAGDRAASLEARVGAIFAQDCSGQPMPESIRSYEAAYEELMDIGEDVVAAEVLAGIGILYCKVGDRAGARERLLTALTLLRRVGRWDSVAITLQQLSLVYRLDGLFEDAMECAMESVNILRESGDTLNAANGMRIAAQLHLDAGHVDRASQILCDALDGLESAYDPRYAVFTLEAAAEVLAAMERWPDSARALGYAWSIEQRHGMADFPVHEKMRTLIERLQAQLGDRYEAAFRFGEILTLDSVRKILRPADDAA